MPDPFEGVPTTPTEPSQGPSAVERWVLKRAGVYVVKRMMEVATMKGYRTLIVNGLLLLSYVLAWGPLTQYLDPQWVAMATVIINTGLRLVTTTPIGGATVPSSSSMQPPGPNPPTP